REFEDLGRFLIAGSRDRPVGTISNRAALTVVELRGTTYLVASSTVNWDLVSASRTDAFLRGTTTDLQVDLAVYTERPQGLLRRLEIANGPVLEASSAGDGGVARLLIKATVGFQPVEARVTDDGHLLLGRTPIDASWVLDGRSGARLDVSGAREFGRVSPNSGSWFNG